MDSLGFYKRPQDKVFMARKRKLADSVVVRSKVHRFKLWEEFLRR